MTHTPAPIRFATRAEIKKFCDGPPPQRAKKLITRRDLGARGLSDRSATHFLIVEDELHAHITKCVRLKNLPQGWEQMKGSIGCHKGDYYLLVREHRKSRLWSVARINMRDYNHQNLSHVLCDVPVVCRNGVSAAHLAEAYHPHLSPRYALTWASYLL
jgi:hypothetical protein